MKNTICTGIGLAGATIASAFGGWDTALRTLIIFMAADYITGLAVAWLGRSQKTESGGLNSHVGYVGLVKKAVILILVLAAYRLDITLGLDYVRNTVIIGFTANELISITENAGLLGVPMPRVIKRAIELLQNKGGDDE